MNFLQIIACIAIVALALFHQGACKEDQPQAENNMNKLTAEDLDNYLNEIEAEKMLLENLETENQMLEELQAENQDSDADSSLVKRDGSKRNSTRRQQAARWDIGFGKRDSTTNKFKKQRPSQFFDSLYGKRSSLKSILNPKSKYSFGRRQQWDIQYGR